MGVDSVGRTILHLKSKLFWIDDVDRLELSTPVRVKLLIRLVDEKQIMEAEGKWSICSLC